MPETVLERGDEEYLWFVNDMQDTQPDMPRAVASFHDSLGKPWSFY
jgi:hypothetical protein